MFTVMSLIRTKNRSVIIICLQCRGLPGSELHYSFIHIGPIDLHAFM